MVAFLNTLDKIGYEFWVMLTVSVYLYGNVIIMIKSIAIPRLNSPSDSQIHRQGHNLNVVAYTNGFGIIP